MVSKNFSFIFVIFEFNFFFKKKKSCTLKLPKKPLTEVPNAALPASLIGLAVVALIEEKLGI